MKKIVFILCIVFSGVLIAKNDVDLSSFNKVLLQNMEEAIEHNPEIYEKDNPGRIPASVVPEGSKVQKATEDMDEILPQADAPKSW